MTGALDSLEERESEEPEPIKAYARARSILAKRDVPFTQQPFAAAIDAFSKRNIVPREVFDKLTDAAKQKSFTVAGLAVEELLGDAHAELDRQLRQSPEHTYKDPETGKWVYKGPNLREFRKFTEERLESAGWTPANPSHVETIFRTNIASAYSTGRVAEMTQPAVLRLRPYWQVRTVKDDRQRKTHRAADGVVLPADHPFWRTAFPPWGFNCRCRVVSRSQKWVDQHGGVSSPPTGLPDPGFASGTQQLLVSGDVLKEFAVKSSPIVTPLERHIRPVELPISPLPPAPAWPKPPPLPKPKAPPKPKGPMSSADIMQLQLSGPKGSNPGGLYRGKDGVERYVKLYADPAQAIGEHVANRVYADLGLGRVKSQLFEHQGKLAYASEIIEGAVPLGQAGLTPELARKALEGLVGDLATANWDAVGMNIDNLLVTKSGKIVRVDNGGTFLSRAKGARKPENLLDQLTEWDGFFNPGKNPAYSKLASIAGVKGPADLLPEIRKQLVRLELTASKAGGWLEYVTKAAPGADKATLERMAQMLESRTELIGQKVKETEKLIVEQKAAAKAAAKAAKKAAKPGKPYKTPAPGEKFRPWDVKAANLEDAVRKLPGRNIEGLRTSARQPSDAGFTQAMDQTVKAIRGSAQVMEGIREYTGSGYGDIRLAERILSGKTFEDDYKGWGYLSKARQLELIKSAEQLAEAQRRVAGLPRPHDGHTLYRGVHLSDKLTADLASRPELVFGGSGSTSFSFNKAAESFAHLSVSWRHDWAVVYEIVEHKSGAAVDLLSSCRGESEVLFPANARFEILSVERIEGYKKAMLVRVREL
jgi:SPP1 gp7 family putative phage head morphogenesis protein